MAENNNQPKPQGQGGQGQKNGNQQNNAQTQAQNGEEQPRPQNKGGGHKPHNRSRNYNNRFEGKKLPAIETVEDIASDISRIEKEIELEIKEIGTMTLG